MALRESTIFIASRETVDQPNNRLLEFSFLILTPTQ